MGVKDPGYDEPLPTGPQSDFEGGCIILVILFLIASAVVAVAQVLF